MKSKSNMFFENIDQSVKKGKNLQGCGLTCSDLGTVLVQYHMICNLILARFRSLAPAKLADEYDIKV